MKRGSQEKVSQESEQSNEHHDEGHQPDVVVADMGKLVGGHAFQLLFIKFLEDTGSENDHRVLGIAARSKGSELAVLDDVYFRDWSFRGDADVFHKPIALA